MFRIKTYRESADRTILLKCTMGRRGELSQLELFPIVLPSYKLNITNLTSNPNILLGEMVVFLCY